MHPVLALPLLALAIASALCACADLSAYQLTPRSMKATRRSHMNTCATCAACACVFLMLAVAVLAWG